MNTFRLDLESATQYEQVENVVSFVGEDESGSFGIMPGHARIVTVLRFGLARFRAAYQDWEYLALPGAVAYFFNNQLHLSTRHYVRGKKFETINTALQEELRTEEEALRDMKRSLSRLEEEMLKRLWELGRKAEVSG